MDGQIVEFEANPNSYLLNIQPETKFELSDSQVDDLKHAAILAKFHFMQMCIFKKLPSCIIRLIGLVLIKTTYVQTVSICDNIENMYDVMLVIADKKAVYSSFK